MISFTVLLSVIYRHQSNTTLIWLVICSYRPENNVGHGQYISGCAVMLCNDVARAVHIYLLIIFLSECWKILRRWIRYL